MSIRFPQPLIERGGQSILLYDSRSVRIHDNKPVFVFAHPYVCFFLIWVFGIFQNLRRLVVRKVCPHFCTQSGHILLNFNE